MQFLWKYIDDLMGKGLEITVIIELLFYVSASLLPLALPLAILLSSLIVMGNLGEYNELTALKSSGLSIYRILRPLGFIATLIAIGTFYFSNYVIPVANFKWHAIIWDIQETKLTTFLKPGAYTQEIDGFSIKISEGKDNTFKRIVIHDKREPNALKTITAQSGEFYRSETGDYLFFKLRDGIVFEESSKQHEFAKEDKKRKKNTFPGKKARFKTATYKMLLTGFEMNRSQDDLFKNDFEMLNVFQINKTVDSLRQNFENIAVTFTRNTKSKHEYFQALEYQPRTMKDLESENFQDTTLTKYQVNKSKKDSINKTKLKDSIPKLIPVYTLDSINESNEKAVYTDIKNVLNTNITTLDNQLKIEDNKKFNLRKFEIEFHRKFALSFSIIILFFIGAPLGAIVKKGGFGAPVVIAALLFMVYFVLITIGDGMAKDNIISPFLGMWGPNFILSPFAVLLMISAANDRSVFNFSWIKTIFKKKS